MQLRSSKGRISIAWLAIVLVSLACVWVAGRSRELAAEEGGSGWIAARADSVCGLDDPRLLSNPALVDHPRCLNATPEMKKMREEHIDPSSPKGIQLTADAVDRVRRAAEIVRNRLGHCSVWKHIRHRDGREIPDVTVPVLAGL